MANETSSLKDKPKFTSTVSVASKLPMDFVLQLYLRVTKHEPVMGGGSREYVIYEKDNQSPSFTITGNSYAQNKGPHQQLAGGFAITHGVPKEFWEKWCEQHRGHAMLENGMLFAHDEAASTIAEAKEKEKVKSNMERMDPNALPKGLATANRAE